jgi:hypothetical protein
MKVLWAVLCALLLAGAALAQEGDGDRLVRLRVTRVDGRFVELDVGAASGLRKGDVVTLRTESLGPRKAIVRAASEATARAEVVGSIAGVSVGTLGEVQVPEARLQPEQEEHPPWSAPIEGWDEDTPLLAEGAKISPEERPLLLNGRAWTEWQSTSTELVDYGNTRAGLSLDAENPYGLGGVLETELRFVDQRADGATSSTNLDQAMRVERLSYAVGGTRFEPERWQVGRFLHYGVPELGVLDGAEYTHRLPSGSRLGAATGYLPQLRGDRRTGEDLSVAVYYKHLFDAEAGLEGGVAVQKTWHEGEADRDLLVLTHEWAPGGPWSLRASALLDLYGSEDQFKDGTELTEGRVTASWFEDGTGASLSLSRMAWPELLRNEFPEQVAEVLAEGQVDRADLYTWTRWDDWRLSASLDSWADQDGSGGSAELRAALQDRLFPDGEVGASVRTRTGRFLEGETARLFAAWWGSRGTWRADLDLSDVDTSASSTIADTWLRLSWDTRLGQDWQLSLRATAQRGDFDSDSFTISLARFF